MNRLQLVNNAKPSQPGSPTPVLGRPRSSAVDRSCSGNAIIDFTTTGSQAFKASGSASSVISSPQRSRSTGDPVSRPQTTIGDHNSMFRVARRSKTCWGLRPSVRNRRPQLRLRPRSATSYIATDQHQEIVDNIIGYVRELLGGHFRAPLKSCALRTRAWIKQSQPHLFHHIKPRYETVFERWCKYHERKTLNTVDIRSVVEYNVDVEPLPRRV